MKKVMLILGLLLLTNCAYQPKINPETSRDTHTGENIAGKYFVHLATCEDIWKYEAPVNPWTFHKVFIRKCMKSYGYDVLW